MIVPPFEWRCPDCGALFGKLNVVLSTNEIIDIRCYKCNCDDRLTGNTREAKNGQGRVLATVAQAREIDPDEEPRRGRGRPRQVRDGEPQAIPS